MFRTTRPLSNDAFHDREDILERLERSVAALEAGEPRWVVIMGHRKIGKTSLLLEAARRFAHPGLRFVVFDVFDALPVSREVFRRLALKILDATLGDAAGAGFSVLADQPAELRQTLAKSELFVRLPPALRATLLELADRPADDTLMRACLELPEALAKAGDMKLVVAIDEFQELAALGSERGAGDPFALMRATWQRHERVAYVVSGSSRTLLQALVTSEQAPFFQHFDPIELGPFTRADAVALLVSEAPRERPISAALAQRAYEVLGGSPFYLQLFGDALTSLEPPYDDAALKEALQQLLFSRAGRLALYFTAEHQRIVGRSAGLAAVLDALSAGPLRPLDVGKKIRASSGTTVRALERLADTVTKQPDGRYAIDDPAFAAWLRWRTPGGTVVPMTLVGDEAERQVAHHLAAMGFELVYQSRASRGAFDLLAIRDGHQLGVQVKRSPLPLRFTKPAWDRMIADAARWGWVFCIVAVSPEGDVAVLDPGKARRGREVRIDAAARIENVLMWLAERG